MAFSWLKAHESSWFDVLYKWANENQRDIDFCTSPIMTRKLGWEGRNYKIYNFDAEPPKYFPSVVNVPQQHAQRHPQVPGKPGTHSTMSFMSSYSCRWCARSKFRVFDLLVCWCARSSSSISFPVSSCLLRCLSWWYLTFVHVRWPCFFFLVSIQEFMSVRRVSSSWPSCRWSLLSHSCIDVVIMLSIVFDCLLALVSIALEFDFFLVSLCLLSSWYEYSSRHSFILWCYDTYWCFRTLSCPSFPSFWNFTIVDDFGALAALASDIDS